MNDNSLQDLGSARLLTFILAADLVALIAFVLWLAGA